MENEMKVGFVILNEVKNDKGKRWSLAVQLVLRYLLVLAYSDP